MKTRAQERARVRIPHRPIFYFSFLKIFLERGEAPLFSTYFPPPSSKRGDEPPFPSFKLNSPSPLHWDIVDQLPVYLLQPQHTVHEKIGLRYLGKHLEAFGGEPREAPRWTRRAGRHLGRPWRGNWRGNWRGTEVGWRIWGRI